MKKIKISLDNLNAEDDQVMVYCQDQEAAKQDQSIHGSRWECPGDMQVAYASICQEKDLVKKLEAGYEVDADQYFPED